MDIYEEEEEDGDVYMYSVRVEAGLEYSGKDKGRESREKGS